MSLAAASDIIKVNDYPEEAITFDEFKKEYANFLTNAAYKNIGISDEHLSPTNFYKIDHFDDRILDF